MPANRTIYCIAYLLTEVEQYSDKYLKESVKPVFRSEIAKISFGKWSET